MIVYLAKRCHHIFLCSSWTFFSFILQCHMCGSARILCRFLKYITMITGPPTPLADPLCSEWDCLYLSYFDPAPLRSTQVFRRWVLGIDFRFEDFVDLILRLDYSLRFAPCHGLGLDTLIWLEAILWSGGNAQQGRLCVLSSGVTTGNNDVQMLTWNRKKHTRRYLFCTCFLFLYCSESWRNVMDVSIKTYCHCSGDRKSVV